MLDYVQMLLDEAQAESDRRLELLKRLEWCVIDELNQASCPLCGGWRKYRHHADDCELAKELVVDT